MIDVHYASLTSQGVQRREIIQMVTHPDINPVQQGLTLVNRQEPVFPFADSLTTLSDNKLFFIDFARVTSTMVLIRQKSLLLAKTVQLLSI